MATQLMAKKSLVRTNREIREDYRPSDDEPFMCSRQRAYFRGKLLAWQNRFSAPQKKPCSTCTKRLPSIPTLQIERARKSIAGWNFARVIVSVS